MKKILFILLLVMASAVNAVNLPRHVDRFHDDELNVTCWKVKGLSGISCIPDSLLEPECGPHEQEQHEPRPASSPDQHQNEERFRL